MAKGGQNRPNTTQSDQGVNVPNDGFTYGLQGGEYVRIPATSGQFKYIGLFSDQNPTIDNNKGEIALHHDTATDVYSIYMSSYDINNYPFAYLAETFGSNYEDNDNIFPTKYSEGAEIVVMSQEPSFAFSGLVVGVARPSFFIITLEQFKGFSHLTPSLTSPQVSFNITSTPSYTRHTARLNKGHFDNSNAPTHYKSLNIVTEKVTCENDIFLLKELESTFTDYPIVLVKPEAFFVFSQENARVIFNNEIIVSNEGNNIYLSLSGILNELGEATGGNIHFAKISAENPTTVNLATGIDVTYDEAVNITFTGVGSASYVGKVQQKHTVKDFTDSFTIPNGTNNATLTMTNPVNKNVTISATSFANVGDACELSSLLGVGYPIVVAATGVALVDPNSVASESFNIKGLRRMNNVGGVIQIQLY